MGTKRPHTNPRRQKLENMKNKGGFLRIKGETFPYDVLVCLGVKREEILAYFDKHFVDALSPKDLENLEMKGHGRVVRLDNNAFVLWTADFPKTPEQFGWLAHEIFHTADLMLRKAGATLSDDSDEVWAYQIDWLTKIIFKAFKL